MIRSLKEEDIPLILSWYNWYIEHSEATFETEQLSLQEFQDRVHMIMKTYPWIILEEDGKPVGYAYLASFIPRAAYDWTIDLAIYLDPEQRGKGYGDLLMDAVIEIAKKAGYVNMVSIITKGNIPSEKLHEKHGFVKMGEFDESGYKFGKWLGVTYYTLRLNPPAKHPDKPINPEI
ncbi:MAG: GNAT family N-acetyltransferase [Erysipelotrichaceae bacterium]|nr:GNAT family N-acetyltransferase [Erysipelotrichaceae bacterium]